MGDVDTAGAAGLPAEILRESLRTRCVHTLPGAIDAGFVAVAVVFLLAEHVPPPNLAAWVLPLAAAMTARIALAKRILRTLAAAPAPRLMRFDLWLRLSSMANQTCCGAGIWMVATHGTPFTAFMVTLVIALFGVGAMINLSSDYRSFVLSMPLLMGQPIAFWAARGGEGVQIALGLMVIAALMVTLVRRSARMFSDSVTMRFEKNAALAAAQRQRAATEEALRTAREAMRSRARFLAAASHDLRQPLYAISILADTLALESLPEGQAGLVEKQRQAIGLLRTLFDNLLDLSRFDAGEVRPVLRAVTLGEILAPLGAEYEALCRRAGLDWGLDVPGVRVHTDPELLRRLVGNLLSNAVRYTPSGGVRLSGRLEGGRALLAVSDTGIGIPPESQAQVFEEFVQLGNEARDRDRGVGLGLSIVKRIGELLDARVALRSAPGEGTTVTLSVPVAGEETAAVPAEEPVFPESISVSGLRVWVIEDDALVREALATQFAAWGLDHAFAQSRVEVASLRESDGGWPDAILLDDMLGRGESGLDIARWLRDSLAADRMAIATGNSDPARLAELEASGVRVFRKPVAASDLARWLARAARAPQPAR